MIRNTNASSSSVRSFWEAASVVWSAVVLSLAITPIRNVEMITAPISDKILHAVAFLIGSIVWAGAMDDTPGQLRSVGLAGLICLGMGALIELLQTQTQTRTGDSLDLLADVVGILLGAGLWIILSQRRQRVSASQNLVEETVGL
ncbi:MAG: VanZ family protein [Calditrichaeota bacterium]|nr:VanZ family protein [Calditrichota bacterium]